MNISFRIKIGIILILLSVLTILIIQYTTRNFVDELLIENLIESKINYLDLLKRGTSDSILLNDDFIMGDTLRNLRKDKDIITALLLYNKNRIYNSTEPQKKGYRPGDTYNFDIKTFTSKKNFFIKKLNDRFILAKDFILKDKDNDYKEFYVILILSMSKINKARARLTYYFIIIGEIIIVLSIILAFPISGIISRRLINISKATDIIGQGNWDHKIKIKSRWRDELDSLAEKINEMSSKIKNYITTLIDHERMKTEIEIGQKIQSRMLTPPDLSSAHFNISGFCYPAKEIGGDFYDFIKITPAKSLITIADVVGKGVGAGILSTMFMTLINTEPLEQMEPLNLIIKTNNFLFNKSLEDDYLTAVIGILDHEKKEFEFCNAMHDSPLFYKKKEDRVIVLEQKDSFWLGQDTDDEFSEGYSGDGLTKQKIVFDKGDILLLYTDGITEQVDKNDKDMGIDMLIENFYNSKDLTSGEIINNIYAMIVQYKGEVEQKDDLTGIVIKAV